MQVVKLSDVEVSRHFHYKNKLRKNILKGGLQGKAVELINNLITFASLV